MNKERRYTAIQQLRKLNAEHHSANVKLVNCFKKNADFAAVKATIGIPAVL
jgi:hypothetical protein